MRGGLGFNNFGFSGRFDGLGLLHLGGGDSGQEGRVAQRVGVRSVRSVRSIRSVGVDQGSGFHFDFGGLFHFNRQRGVGVRVVRVGVHQGRGLDFNGFHFLHFGFGHVGVGQGVGGVRSHQGDGTVDAVQ